MTRATYRFLDSDPPSVSHSLLAVQNAIGERARLFEPGPWQNSWVGRGERHFVYVADSPAGRRRILLETGRLQWAALSGISAPAVVAAAPDGSWLATERVADDVPAGPAYVRAAVALAEAVAAAPPPPPSFLAGSEERRASRWTLPARLARLAASPIDVREFVAVRRRALTLPADQLAHGDYHPGNVLFDATSGRAFVTDMEFLGMAPRGTDLMTLWCGLERSEDRDAVLEAVLAGATDPERTRLAVLHHWLALRSLADVALVPRRFRHPGTDHPALLGHSMARAREARADAAAWTRSRTAR
ncbi:MAG: aminoglycoside phosphotransferase family protein [Actinomycetota bacterium]|nr:aminoglycoside phosphotransferase family protein [Actinomycetota bacterium]